jgi:hypothetical protein
METLRVRIFDYHKHVVPRDEFDWVGCTYLRLTCLPSQQKFKTCCSGIDRNTSLIEGNWKNLGSYGKIMKIKIWDLLNWSHELIIAIKWNELLSEWFLLYNLTNNIVFLLISIYLILDIFSLQGILVSPTYFSNKIIFIPFRISLRKVQLYWPTSRGKKLVRIIINLILFKKPRR